MAVPDDVSAEREADRVTVHQFAPPGVLINSQLQVLQFRGTTGAWLEPPKGRANFDLLKMAREGLMLPLRAAIKKASKTNKAVRQESVRVQRDGVAFTVHLHVIPLKNVPEPCFLILFEEPEHDTHAATHAAKGGTAIRRTDSGAVKRPAATRESRLVAELSELHDFVHSLQTQHEAANEELQASNEEVQSANEELLSLNEELETSKEELESANEELTTVNEEMINRNAELNRLNGDLTNFQASTGVAVVLLGRDLGIRRFSPQAETHFGLVASDLGRPMDRLRHGLVLADADVHGASPATRGGAPHTIERVVEDVIASGVEVEREVRDKNGRWFSLRVRPYVTLDNKVDGAVLALFDIDVLKHSAQAIARARDYAEAVIRTVPDPLLILDASLRVQTASESFCREFRVSASETEGRLIYDLGSGEWNIPGLRLVLEEILPYHRVFNGYEVTHVFEKLGRRTMLLSGRALAELEGDRHILLLIQDVTERRVAEVLLKESDRNKGEFLATLAHELRNPLATMRSALHVIGLTGNAEDMQAARRMVERQVGHMTRLVDDLLDVSQINQGKIELRRERVDVGSVVNDAVDAMRPSYEARGVELTTSMTAEPTDMVADPHRLMQVMDNLLTNARKFTDKGDRVAVHVERDGDQGVIRVRDSGIGIEADQLERIFGMFVQLPASLERSAGGVGLGLPLVKRLVELHGGTVGVNSAGAGSGSEFVVHLPLLAQAGASSARSEA